LVSRKARAAGTLVVVIQHETKDGDMDYGTDSWTLAPALEVHSSDVFLRKTASDSFHGTGLRELLVSRGITNLVICGLQSEFCVDTTTRRAMALGYPGRAFHRRQRNLVSSSDIGSSQQDSLRPREFWAEDDRSVRW
jgi:nicotinamidase-related amidase